MPPKGTSGRGGISNPPCMADAKEEMPKEKQQRKKDEEKSDEEKSDRICGAFFLPLFYKGGEREDLSLVGSRVEREERDFLLWSYASNDYI